MGDMIPFPFIDLTMEDDEPSVPKIEPVEYNQTPLALTEAPPGFLKHEPVECAPVTSSELQLFPVNQNVASGSGSGSGGHDRTYIMSEYDRISKMFRSAFAEKCNKDGDIEVLEQSQVAGTYTGNSTGVYAGMDIGSDSGVVAGSWGYPVTGNGSLVVAPRSSQVIGGGSGCSSPFTPKNNQVVSVYGGGSSGRGSESNGAVFMPEEAERRVVVKKPRTGRPRSNKLFRANDMPVEEQRKFRYLVKKTRMMYESIRLHMMEENENITREEGKRNRLDLAAAGIMKDCNLWLNRDKRIVGTIPGVYVGDIFTFRMELCVIGVHGQVQAGIDFVPLKGCEGGDTIATSIVVSGGYEDDEDSGDVIIYTGQGGQAKNSLRQCVDQKLDGGNLALQKSMQYGIEIRVIRGIKDERVPSGRIYVYDGLYKVEESWFATGKSGFNVYKFKLVRMEGQFDVGSPMIKFAEQLRSSPLSVRPKGYLSLDISNGKEVSSPVSLYNDIDSDADPMMYEYLVNPIYPLTVPQSKFMGCDCARSCSANCLCIQKNGGEFPYDKNGILLRGRPVIFECGNFCHCSSNCRNRVSQKGLKHRLEIFRSKETGWGVRPLDKILAGDFICEFTGLVLTREQAAILSMNGDSLVYPNRFPERWVEWGDVSQVYPEYQRPIHPSIPPLDFAMDVSRMRNVACYISHSSTPNVLVQFVLYDHHNVMYPHLMLFAMENIPPLRELSLDYGVVDDWAGKLAICN